MRRRSPHRRISATKRLSFLFEGLEPRLVMDGVPTDEVEAFWPAFIDCIEDHVVEVAANGRMSCVPQPRTLERFESADQLEQHLLQQSVQQWKSLFGTRVPDYYPPIDVYDSAIWPGWGRMELQAAGNVATDGNFSFSVNYSNTNVQVAGVDEGDLVKTDGSYLYVIRENRLTIVDVRDPTDMQIVSRVALDQPAKELYLDGDRLTVISSTPDLAWYPAIAITQSIDIGFHPIYPQYRQPTVQLDVYDISDRAAPKEVSTFIVEGNLIRSSAVGSQVILVTQDEVGLPIPELHCEETNEIVESNLVRRLANGMLDHNFIRGPQSCVYETEAEYVERVSDGMLDRILPHYRTSQTSDEPGAFLTDPDKVVATNQVATQMVSTTVFDIGEAVPHVVDSAGILTPYINNVYVNGEHVYVAGQEWAVNSQKTQIVQFSLGQDLDSVEVTAIGRVSGYLLNQFSMDEHEGFLRLATTEGWGPSASSNVFVLQASEERLEVVGSLTGIAPRETIFAARFMGDEGYLVTFERIDPLFALDLSDPRNPVILGELEMPGFSHYLHPLGNEHLIGLGFTPDQNRPFQQVPQVSLFDVSNMLEPKRVDIETFADHGGAWSQAMYDHHAISFFEDVGIFAIPFQYYDFSLVDAVPWLDVVPAPFLPDVYDVNWPEFLKTQIPDIEDINQAIRTLPQNISVREAIRHIRQFLPDSLKDFLPDELPSIEVLRERVSGLPRNVKDYEEQLGSRFSSEMRRLFPPMLAEGESRETRPAQPRAGLRLFHIDPTAENPIEPLGTISHDRPIERSLRIGGTLFSISHDTIQAHSLADPDQLIGEVAIGRLTVDDTVSVASDGGPARIDVLKNDRVGENAKIVAVDGQSVRGGKVEISENGKLVIYTPPSALPAPENSDSVRSTTDQRLLTRLWPEGHDSFTYTVDLGNGITEKATVQVQLTRTRIVPKMAELARNHLAEQLSIPVDQIQVSSVEPRIWANSCLGVRPAPGECVPEITPGFVVWLTANGRRYEYHTDTVSRVVSVSNHLDPREGTVDDFFYVPSDSTDYTLDVLRNDFPNTEFIRAPEITAVSDPSNGGTVRIQEGGFKLIYTPASGFEGVEIFTYTVDNGLTSNVTVHVMDLDSTPDEPDSDSTPDDPGDLTTVVTIRLEVTDAAGNVVQQVEQGEQFYINVYVNDLRNAAQGVFSAYMDLAFDVQLAKVNGEFEFSSEFANGLDGVADRTGINEIGAFAGSLKPLGPGEQLLVRVPLEALRIGRLSIASNPADESPQHDVGVFGRDASIHPRQIDFASVDVQIVNSFHNDVEPTDANGDGTTSPIDALRIINWINANGSGSTRMLKAARVAALAAGEAFNDESHRFDTNGDGHCTHMDVLAIFNRVNADAARRLAEAELQVQAAAGVVAIEGESSTAIPAESLTVEARRVAELRSLAGAMAASGSQRSANGPTDIGSRAVAIEAYLDDLVGPVPSTEMLDDWFTHLGL